MTNNRPERVSATIHQFPLRGRFAADQMDSRFAALERMATVRKVPVLDTDGWYHNEEIKTDPARH